MRKVMGASKRQVFMQFMGESSLITFIAAILALCVKYFFYSLFQQYYRQTIYGRYVVATIAAYLH